MSAPITRTAAGTQKDYAGSSKTPFGTQFVNRGEALDHAGMRSGQLRALLQLIGGVAEDSDFDRLPVEHRDNLMWLARQLADEVEALFHIVADDVKGGQK